MERVSKNPLISVIIPVYKVEQYLNKCVDSIIVQTYKNIEILLIDDGSPDNCPKICDEYAKTDKRIKVIHKENGGLSDARNVGLKHANGKYVTFVDSDDSLAPDYIEYMYNLSIKNKTQISVSPYIVVTDRKEILTTDKKIDCVLRQKDALKAMILDDGFTVSACSKLYEKTLFEDICFPKGKIFEDTATTYKIFLKCDNIAYGHKGGYYYYKRDDSIINSQYNRNQLQFVEFTDNMGDDILKIYPDLTETIESKRIDSRFSVLRRMVLTKELSEEDLKDKKEIEKYILSRKKKILKGKFNKKIKIATVLLSISSGTFKTFWKLYSFLKYKI